MPQNPDSPFLPGGMFNPNPDSIFNGEGPPAETPGGGGGAPGSGEAPDFTDENTQNPYDPNERVGDQFGYQTGVNGEKNYDINVGMTGGLMDTVERIGDSRWANKGYGVRGGNAANRNVRQEELSQYQLQQMLASNSPLMQQAAASGMARGGARGLMNSSLSMGAAQGAMISGAQPFALQDAGWYGQTAADNMNATNSMEEANLRARTASMEAGGRRDISMLGYLNEGYGDIRKAMIDMETREDKQAWDTGERLGGEAWKTAEGEAGREWSTGEREGTQGFTAEQNELNRVWTSNENLMDRSLSQWQTTIDAGVRMGMAREQAFSEMYSNIMASTAKGFTAEKKRQAVRDMAATIDARYAKTPEIEPGPFETSFLSGETDESLMLPKKDLPGTSSQTFGNTTIVRNADGSTSITIYSANGEVQDTFNSMPPMGP